MIARKYAAGVATVAGIGLCALTAAMPASAATAGGAGAFGSRALTAGVAQSQITQVQSEVKSFLSHNSGTQVALNKVDFDGGNIEFDVAGVNAQQESAAGIVPLDTSCSYYYFCGWSGDNFTGNKISIEKCGVYHAIGWGAGGSWKNNESTGTQAGMYNSSYDLIYLTPPAYSQDATGNWTPVYYLRAC